MSQGNTDQATPMYDLFVIGGGVNGVGIANDAAGRGLRVMLAEQRDLASATSSSSSKLIHGGLRYLEYYEFRLVKEALKEREVLLNKAPHIVWPLRFRLPHRPHLRPAWMIRAGLFLYDNLSKRTTLPAASSLRFGANSALNAEITKGFEYSDCWVDDARLVVLNAMQARELGAVIKTRTSCVNAKRDGSHWVVTLQEEGSAESYDVRAKALVNAAGPWVSSFFDTALKRKSPKNIRLVQGSHMVVPRIHEEKAAYILQNDDKRIVFVIPYMDKYSLIGTTDLEYKGDPYKVHMTEDEISYLIDVTNKHFRQQIKRDDVVWTYAGVRPLLDDEANNPSAVTRDYTFEVEDTNGVAPLVSIFGGKITTYRKLSEAAVNRLQDYFPHMHAPWTAGSILPGGEFRDHASFLTYLKESYPWAPEAMLQRFVRSYGTLARSILGNAQSVSDLGKHFGADLYQAEVDYLIEQEWAVQAEDILWRRSKLGLALDSSQQAALRDYLSGDGKASHLYAVANAANH